MGKMWNELVERHKNPINLGLQTVGFIALVYGLWMHNWTVIIVAVVTEVVGHAFPPPEKKIEIIDKFVDILGFTPVNFVFQIVAFMVYVYGLWQHDWILIGVGCCIALVGFTYGFMRSR
ncbi:MAG: hypothetical protein QMC78_02045 [Methanocellales archaeon]|nr:hypothetical protein [Methanocellales archaeon]